MKEQTTQNNRVSSDVIQKALSAYMQAEEANVATVEYVGVLTSELKTQLEEKIVKLFPESATLEFVENPKLIAGLRISFRDQVYDDSVVGRFGKLRSLTVE